jgi:N-acylneuraminate cytidylyltransferase
MAWSRVVLEGRTIAGTVLMPFLTRGSEGFDVNKPYDWDMAEHMVKAGAARLPDVMQSAYRMD